MKNRIAIQVNTQDNVHQVTVSYTGDEALPSARWEEFADEIGNTTGEAAALVDGDILLALETDSHDGMTNLFMSVRDFNYRMSRWFD